MLHPPPKSFRAVGPIPPCRGDRQPGVGTVERTNTAFPGGGLGLGERDRAAVAFGDPRHSVPSGLRFAPARPLRQQISSPGWIRQASALRTYRRRMGCERLVSANGLSGRMRSGC